jgi:hypothetical protein
MFGQIVTVIDHLTFNSASFVPNASNSDAGYILLTNSSQPAASYHIALGVTPQNPTQQIITDYNIGAWGSGHPTEVVDTVHLSEPSTWAMMLLGFLGLGAALRRSRRNVSVA